MTAASPVNTLSQRGCIPRMRQIEVLAIATPASGGRMPCLRWGFRSRLSRRATRVSKEKRLYAQRVGKIGLGAGGGGRRAVGPDDLTGDPDHDGSGRHRPDHHRVGADLAAVADHDVAGLAAGE